MKSQSLKRIFCMTTILLMLCASLPLIAEAVDTDINFFGGTHNVGSTEVEHFNTYNADVTIDSGAVVKVNSVISIGPGSLYVNGTLDISNCGTISNNGKVIVNCSGEIIGNMIGSVTHKGHDYNENGVCKFCGAKGCEIGELDHVYENGICKACGIIGCEAGLISHNYEKGICTVCNHKCDNPFHEDACPECGMESMRNTGTFFSGGSLTIVAMVACLAVGFVFGVIVKKNKKSVQ